MLLVFEAPALLEVVAYQDAALIDIDDVLGVVTLVDELLGSEVASHNALPVVGPGVNLVGFLVTHP